MVQEWGILKKIYLYVVNIIPVSLQFLHFFPLSFMIDFNALSTHHDNQKMNPIQVHNHIWSPHKSPCHYNHHRLHTKTLQDIFLNYLFKIDRAKYSLERTRAVCFWIPIIIA